MLKILEITQANPGWFSKFIENTPFNQPTTFIYSAIACFVLYESVDREGKIYTAFSSISSGDSFTPDYEMPLFAGIEWFPSDKYPQSLWIETRFGIKKNADILSIKSGEE